MKLSEELKWRGFVAQHTFKSISDLDEKKRKFYLGVDPSDNSMTIGNLAAIMMAKCFVRHGYEATLLVGGATGMIGDPKDTAERDLKPLEEIERNKNGIRGQFERIMGQTVHMVDNYDWFKNIELLPFLREVGKQFSMTQLLDRDFVKSRIGKDKSGISFAEFSYSLLQGYDYLHLFREYGVSLQLCGADQWGNAVSGMHLIKRLEGKEVDVWSTPLIIDKVTGRKFGKSEGNAVWLDADRTSVFDFYQFWLNVDDESVKDYIKIYTEITPSEIDEILKLHAKDPSARGAQKALALGVTEVVHGREAAVNAAHITNVLFSGGDITELTKSGLDLLALSIPTVVKNTTVVQALIEAGFANSNSEALRLISGNAVSVNGNKISVDQEINELSLIKKGKNNFVLVR